MDCLQNRIGILGCGAPSTEANPEADPPVEGLPVLFINSLPGVSLQKIDSLADAEQETFLGVWADVALRALKKFEILVKAQLNKCYRITDKTILECLICEHKALFDVALWYLHGTELMIEITSSEVINRWTTVDLQKAEELKESFYIEFQAALADAVGSINPEDSDCIESCVECHGNVKWVFQTP
jgi:hypothetical protein